MTPQELYIKMQEGGNLSPLDRESLRRSILVERNLPFVRQKVKEMSPGIKKLLGIKDKVRSYTQNKTKGGYAPNVEKQEIESKPKNYLFKHKS